MIEVDLRRVNSYLAHKQGFCEGGEGKLDPRSPALFGIYGYSPTCYLSFVARVRTCTFDQIDQHLYQQKSFVRFRAMRGSMFLIPSCHFSPVFQATRGTIERIVQGIHKYARKLGVTEKEFLRLAEDIETILTSGGPKTADELRELNAIAKKKEGVRSVFPYIIHVLCYGARLVRGKVRGGWRSNLYEYVRFHDWLPDVEINSIPARKSEAELARLYFQAFGPATEEDFRWWSGFSGSHSMRVLESLKGEMIQLKIRDLPGSYLLHESQLQANAQKKRRC